MVSGVVLIPYLQAIPTTKLEVQFGKRSPLLFPRGFAQRLESLDRF